MAHLLSTGGGDVSFHDSQVYHGTVWVFAHIGGLLTINPDGSLRSINQNFASTLLGYNSEELIGEVWLSFIRELNVVDLVLKLYEYYKDCIGLPKMFHNCLCDLYSVYFMLYFYR